MVDSSLTVDLIDGFDRLNINLLSKSSPSSASPFQINHSQQGTSLGIQDISSSPLPSKSNVLNNNKGTNLSHVPCKFFKQGTCTAGANCIFSHNLTPTSEASVCKYFLKGNCKFGTKCALLHTMSPYGEGRKLLMNRNNNNNSNNNNNNNLGSNNISFQQQQTISPRQMAFSLGSTSTNTQWVNGPPFISSQQLNRNMDDNHLYNNNNNYSSFYSNSENISSSNGFSSQLTAAIQHHHHQDTMPLNQMYNSSLITTNTSPRDSILATSYDYNLAPIQRNNNNNNNHLVSMNRMNNGSSNDGSNNNSNNSNNNNNNNIKSNGHPINNNANNNSNNGFNGITSTSSSSFLHSIPETSASSHYFTNDYQLKENYENDIRPSSSFHDQTQLHQVYNNNPYSSSHENYYHQEQQPKLSTNMKNGPSPSSSSFPYEPSFASENSRAYSNDTPHTNYFDLFGSSSKSFISPQPQQQHFSNGQQLPQQQQQGNEKWSGSLLIGSSSLPGYFDQRPTNYHTQQQQHLSLEKNNIATTNAINIPNHRHYHTTSTTNNMTVNNNEKNNNKDNITVMNSNNNNNSNNNHLFRLGDHYTQGGSFTQNSSFKQPSEQSFILGSPSIDLSQQQQHHRDYTTLKTITPPTPSITTVGTSTTSTPLNDDNDPFYMEDTDISHHHDQQRLEDLGYIPSYSSLIRPTS